MKNPLNRRLPRELKGEMGKYMVIFLFMMLTIGFTSGYFVANSSMLQASEESYDKYNIEDGHFVVKDEISASLQRKLEQEDVKIYKDFYKEEAVDTDNDGKSDGSIRVFAEREKVNLICVMKGSMPKGKAEIAVDRMYADNNDIKKIVSLCDEVEELLKQKKDHTQKDIEFHTAIAMGSKNLIIPRLIPIINSSIPLFVETTGNVLKVETIETHREIATAIAQHNAIKAQDAMTMHLMYNRRCINSKQNL